MIRQRKSPFLVVRHYTPPEFEPTYVNEVLWGRQSLPPLFKQQGSFGTEIWVHEEGSGKTSERNITETINGYKFAAVTVVANSLTHLRDRLPGLPQGNIDTFEAFMLDFAVTSARLPITSLAEYRPSRQAPIIEDLASLYIGSLNLAEIEFVHPDTQPSVVVVELRAWGEPQLATA